MLVRVPAQGHARGETVKLSRRHRKILRAVSCGQPAVEDVNVADDPTRGSLVWWQGGRRVGWRAVDELAAWGMMRFTMDRNGHPNGLLTSVVTDKGLAALRRKSEASAK